jgi:AcrR family transcriptional regulator
LLDSSARCENAWADDRHFMPRKSVTSSTAPQNKDEKTGDPFRVSERTLSARGQRSRDRLKQAAVTCMNRSGFRALRVQDITGEAGVANGLFYRYFEDLNEIAVEISSDLFVQLIERVDGVDAALEPFAWIEQIHAVTVGAFSENPGILACLFGKSDDENGFSKVWDANAHSWNLRVARQLVAWRVAAHEDAESLCFTLGAVTEGLLYQALVRRTSDLIGVTGDTTDGLARLIATIWYRIIFLASPAGSPAWIGSEAPR